MKKLSTLLAINGVLALVGCQSDKHASRTAAPIPVAVSPQISYSFDESFRKYFQPRVEYVFDANMRTYFGPHGDVALERSLSEVTRLPTCSGSAKSWVPVQVSFSE